MATSILLFVLALTVAFSLWSWRRGSLLQWQAARQQTEINSLYRDLQRTAEQARARQEALFNSMMEGVLILDLQQKVLLVNKTLVEWFDFRNDIVGNSLIEVFRSYELQELVQKAPGHAQGISLEWKLSDLPSPKVLQVHGTTIRNQAGERQGTIVVFHDLSQLKRLENLRQEFVANVSHELRTPLHIIKGSIETIQGLSDGDHQAHRRFLEIIQKHTDRLSLLIEDLLILSQLDSGRIYLNMQREELSSSVRRVLDDLQLQASQRGVALHNRVGPDFQVRADAQRLFQILFNLVDNAVKYGHPRGNVEIGARYSDPKMVEVWVRDDGPGIPAESAERIFERFFRLDRARSRDQGGTGLGLSIVKNLVQAQGGKVWVKPQADPGASFHFTLPQSL